MVGPIELEALLHIRKGREETRVVEQGGQVQQLRVGPQAESRARSAEEENPPGVMEDEGLVVSWMRRVASATACVSGISTPAMISVMTLRFQVSVL